MADTTYVDNSAPAINADWLNDVNRLHYTILSDPADAAAVRTAINVENGATADQSNAEIETAYNAQVSVVTQGDAEAGTSTTVYRWTPQRVGQSIAALAQDVGAYEDLTTVSGTTSNSAAGWAGDLIECTNAAATTITVIQSTHAAKDWFAIVQNGAGQVTVAAGASMTMRKNAAYNAKTAAQYSIISVHFRSATEFYLSGDLEVA